MQIKFASLRLSFLLQDMGLMEPISRLASHQSRKTSRCRWHLLYPWAGPNSAPGPGFAWPRPPHETYKTEPLGLGGIILLETEQRHSRDLERVPISSLSWVWVREAGSRVRKPWEELGGKERHCGPPIPQTATFTPQPHPCASSTRGARGGRPPCIPQPIPQLRAPTEEAQSALADPETHPRAPLS